MKETTQKITPFRLKELALTDLEYAIAQVAPLASKIFKIPLNELVTIDGRDELLVTNTNCAAAIAVASVAYGLAYSNISEEELTHELRTIYSKYQVKV